MAEHQLPADCEGSIPFTRSSLTSRPPSSVGRAIHGKDEVISSILIEAHKNEVSKRIPRFLWYSKPKCTEDCHLYGCALPQTCKVKASNARKANPEGAEFAKQIAPQEEKLDAQATVFTPHGIHGKDEVVSLDSD